MDLISVKCIIEDQKCFFEIGMDGGYRRNDAGFCMTAECVLEEKHEFGLVHATVSVITDLEHAGWILLLISV